MKNIGRAAIAFVLAVIAVISGGYVAAKFAAEPNRDDLARDVAVMRKQAKGLGDRCEEAVLSAQWADKDDQRNAWIVCQEIKSIRPGMRAAAPSVVAWAPIITCAISLLSLFVTSYFSYRSDRRALAELQLKIERQEHELQELRRKAQQAAC
jgi:hypothetical protein